MRWWVDYDPSAWLISKNPIEKLEKYQNNISKICCRMERERKESKRGTLESFFALTATKEEVHDQSTLIDGECFQWSVGDNVLLSSPPKTPILLKITDDESTQQSKTTEALSSSLVQQLELTVLPSTATHTSLTPVDISCSEIKRPAQPKLPSYKKNKQNRSFQPHWYSMFMDRLFWRTRLYVFCFYCRHFTSRTHLNIRVRICLFENSFLLHNSHE